VADEVIVRHVAETAMSLRTDRLSASTITIGFASEQAFLLLIEAIAAALDPADKPRFYAGGGQLSNGVRPCALKSTLARVGPRSDDTDASLLF
jgi:hypothetical protein